MYAIHHPSDFQWLVIAAFTVVSTARISRLLVHDHWPPAVRIRNIWDALIPDKRGKATWNLLLHCHYCLTVWVAIGVVLWGYFTDWNLIWLLFNGTLTAAYGAAILVTYDGDD